MLMIFILEQKSFTKFQSYNQIGQSQIRNKTTPPPESMMNQS